MDGVSKYLFSRAGFAFQQDCDIADPGGLSRLPQDRYQLAGNRDESQLGESAKQFFVGRLPGYETSSVSIVDGVLVLHVSAFELF